MKHRIGLAILWPELIRRRLMTVFASYRPELHYMRGRGPKWREKHARPPGVALAREAVNEGVAFEQCVPHGREIISSAHQFCAQPREIA